MSVQLIANNPNVPGINVANGNFHELHKGPLKQILGITVSANDLEATTEQAEACAKALELWAPQTLTVFAEGYGLFVQRESDFWVLSEEFQEQCGGVVVEILSDEDHINSSGVC